MNETRSNTLLLALLCLGGAAALALMMLTSSCAPAYAEPAGTPRDRCMAVDGTAISPTAVTTGPVTASSLVVNGGTNSCVQVGSGYLRFIGGTTTYSMASACSGGTEYFAVNLGNGQSALGSATINLAGGNVVTSGGTGIAANTTWHSSIASGSNAFTVDNNGARVDFGSGASDYASSDGTTVAFAGPVGIASTITGTTSAGNAVLTLDNSTGSQLAYASNYFKCDSVKCVTNAGLGTPGGGTGITATYSAAVRTFVHKVVITNAAMAAAATTDVTIHTTPVNTRIIRVTADVTQTFTGGALSAVTIQCGNSAGGNQYLLANSVFTAQNTWGDAAAEIGAGLLSATVADMGTSAAGVPGAITVQCRFTCTGANCSAATQGSVSVYVEGVTY